MKSQRNEQLLVAAFVPIKTKKRLEAMAKKQGINLSQLLRKQFKKLVGC